MENSDKQQNPIEISTTNPVPVSPILNERGNFILIVGVIFLVLVGTAIGSYYFLYTKKNNGNLNQNTQNINQNIPPQSPTTSPITNIDTNLLLKNELKRVDNPDGGYEYQLNTRSKVIMKLTSKVKGENDGYSLGDIILQNNTKATTLLKDRKIWEQTELGNNWNFFVFLTSDSNIIMIDEIAFKKPRYEYYTDSSKEKVLLIVTYDNNLVRFQKDNGFQKEVRLLINDNCNNPDRYAQINDVQIDKKAQNLFNQPVKIDCQPPFSGDYVPSVHFEIDYSNDTKGFENNFSKVHMKIRTTKIPSREDLLLKEFIVDLTK